MPSLRPTSIRAFQCAIVIAAVGACATDAARIAAPASVPAAVLSIQQLPGDPLGARVEHNAQGENLIRARYTANDSTDAGSTPWQAPDSSIVVLGLKPGQTYYIYVETQSESGSVFGPAMRYDSPPLPDAISKVQLNLEGSFSGGYSLAPIAGLDGHGYLIAFDSTGTIRWYHDFGAEQIFATTQQRNGEVTAFVGFSDGFDGKPGAYVALAPDGDSLRTVSAPTGGYTDPHELVETFDATGKLEDDYLFGYAFRAEDRTAEGGGPADIVAVHQLLSISASGQVDTLISSDAHWTEADHIEPPYIPDLDHPNSLAFDRDGGVIISYRDLNAIVKVDQRTRRIVWQLGGTHNQFTFVNDPLGGFDGQHCVRVLPNGDLLIFDNGWMHSPAQSRAVEYRLDTVNKTATMVWQYSPEPVIFNDFTGSVQRLANGNTLIAWTRKGIIEEVRPDGTVVARARLETSPGTIATPYRVTRINNFYSYATP